MNWILGLIIIGLLIFILNDKRKTKMIKLKLQSILNENSKERIKTGNLSRDKQELVRHINILLDRYHSISVDNRNYKQQQQRMISDIAHDIRTPLTAIIGYVDLLKDNSLEENKKEEYINVIHERGNALKELMEEFFQLAKLECSDMEIKTEKVNVTETIRQNIIAFMNEINEKQMEPDINLGEEEIFALGDKNALSRVITNLVSNSLKYGYEGKVIGIELKAHDKFVKMTVWDRGKGIEKSRLPLIFDRLYTEEKSRNRAIQGSGLGLTIVKKLVEDMNGSIEVNSIPYDKTSFTVTLPIYKEV